MKTRSQLSGGSGIAVNPEKVFNILLGVTGSVATVKLIELIRKIKSMFPRPYTNKSNGTTTDASVCIRVVMTHNSQHFLAKDELTKSLNDANVEMFDDAEEWKLWKKMSDPVLHIELRKWADLCLIAPLDANTMAKLSHGICDNLLTCVVRAWDMSKPLVYCPAMNVHMYNHPITKEHLCKLKSFGYLCVDCVEKTLACGDVGMGGMASVETIANKVIDCLFQFSSIKMVLSKPLLNQQPIYPIIATTHDQAHRANNSSINIQTNNKFRTNNQITIHAFPNANTNNNIDSSSSIFKNHENSKILPLDNGALDSNEESTYSNGFEEDFGIDFDPSKLLEQTMITEESSTFEQDTKGIPIDDLRNTPERNSFGEGGARVGNSTPLFNTSKFLALCHNKERGCFTCTICKNDYKNRKSMARHLKEQHVQGNIYQCKPCGVSYKRREKLIKHNRERHPQTSY